MKTAHTQSAHAAHGNSALGAPRRPGLPGQTGTPANAFAQLLAGLGDAAQDLGDEGLPNGVNPTTATSPDQPLAVSTTVAPQDPGATPSLPATPTGVDGQTMAMWLGQPLGGAADSGAATADTASTGLPATASLFPGAHGGRTAKAATALLGDKPELPAQAAPRAAVASGRALTTDDGLARVGQDASRSGNAAPVGVTATSVGAQPEALATDDSPTLLATAPSAAQPDPSASLPATALTANTEQAAGRTRLAPGRLVSLAARNPATAGSPAHSLAQLERDDDVTTRSWHMLVAGQPGSGLAMGEPTAVMPLPTEALTTTQAHNDSQGDGQPGQSSGQGLAAASEPQAVAAGPEGAEATANPAPAFARSLDQALQSLGAQVSLWSSQKLQPASMDLDTGSGQSLQVDVTMEDGKVEVQFRSDDAATREAIRAHASAALGDLLGRNGMDLAGLSVASQGLGARSGQEDHPQQPGRGRPAGTSLDRSVATELDTRPRVLRSDRTLDLYA